MNGVHDAIGLWLADFQLLALALLGGAAAALAAMRQPARRLAVVRSTLAGLAMLAVLCALPGWSVVHLLSADRGASAAPAIGEPLTAATERGAPVKLRDDAARWQGESAIDVGSAKPQAALERVAREVAWGRVAVVVYLGGSLAVVIWLVCGSVLAGRVRWSAAPAAEELQSLLKRIVGAERTPALLVSQRIQTAVALGLRRPTIILSEALVRGDEGLCIELAGEPRSPSPGPRGGPASGESGGMAAVLAHEWAHVRHGDLWTLAAARLVMVLVWLQPLFWLMRRWMRLDQETLADAAAAEVAGRVGYAEQLLGWARQAPAARAPRLAGAVGLWEGPSQLKRRVAALLDEKLSVVRQCSRRWRVGSACLMLAAACGLSLVTLQRAEQRARAAAVEAEGANTPAASATPAQPASEPSTEVMQRVKSAFGKLKQNPNAIVGVCLDDAGEPLAGVEVTLYRLTLGADRRPPKELSRQKTDEAGQFKFVDVVDAAKEFPNGPPDEAFPASVGMLGVLARASGTAFDGESITTASALKLGAAWVMSLKPAATLQGRVTDADGNAVADAAVSVGYEPLPGMSLNTARTDAEGRYAIENLDSWDAEATRKWFEAERAKREQDGTVDGWLATSVWGPGEPPKTLLTVQHPDFAVKLVEVAKIPGEANVELAPGAVLEGRVAFTEKGQSRPAANVAVTVVHQTPADGAVGATPSYMLMRQGTARTDADGRYRVNSLPPGKFFITAAANEKEWVTNGLHDVEAVRGEVVQAPELALTPGALVRLQLVDVETGKPLELKGMHRAYVNPVRLPLRAFQWPVLTDNVIKVNSKGESKVRVPPGRYEFLITMPETDWQHPFWSASNDVATTQGTLVAEGERTSVTVPMKKIDAPTAATAFVVGGGPPADNDAKVDEKDTADGKAGELAAAVDSYAKPRPKKFVRIVVGPGGELTYQGEKTTWDALPAMLDKVQQRDKTVLEIAIASDEMSVRESNEAQTLGFRLADRFKFLYKSYVGVHPLGSKGTDVETR